MDIIFNIILIEYAKFAYWIQIWPRLWPRTRYNKSPPNNNNNNIKSAQYLIVHCIYNLRTRKLNPNRSYDKHRRRRSIQVRKTTGTTFKFNAIMKLHQNAQRRHRMTDKDGLDEHTLVMGSTSTLLAITLLLSLGFCIGIFQFVNANPQCMAPLSGADATWGLRPPTMLEFTTNA